jgi:hypothetical protein
MGCSMPHAPKVPPRQRAKGAPGAPLHEAEAQTTHNVRNCTDPVSRPCTESTWLRLRSEGLLLCDLVRRKRPWRERVQQRLRSTQVLLYRLQPTLLVSVLVSRSMLSSLSAAWASWRKNLPRTSPNHASTRHGVFVPSALVYSSPMSDRGPARLAHHAS